jgi:hypothetical protein
MLFGAVSVISVNLITEGQHTQRKREMSPSLQIQLIATKAPCFNLVI